MSAAVVSLPAANCAWQQTLRADGSCAVEPRSCMDCLNQRLQSGEKCVLTPVGLCADIAQYDYKQDFRQGGPAGSPAMGFPVRYNYFPSGNSTYCASGDAHCRACQETTFTYDDQNPSTYCTGADGCVCVKACESPSWRNETLERLRNSTDAVANATCPVAANASTTYNGSDSSSGDGSPAITNILVKKNVYANENECRWYQNQTFCDVPRSCYDCLNVALYSGGRCMINPLGFCAPMSEYDYKYDFRSRPSPNASHYFPSNATYCEPSDAVCARCKATVFQDSASGSLNPTQFCVGANGCVCVAICESPNWKPLVKEATCLVSVVTVTSKVPFSITSLALMMMGFTLLFTVSVQFLTVMRNRRRVRREQERREHRLQVLRERSVAGGQQLQLEGWKSMCQELISKEREFHGEGQHEMAILTHGDGPTVMVEEGDGYRPMSPSNHAPSSQAHTRPEESHARGPGEAGEAGAHLG